MKYCSINRLTFDQNAFVPNYLPMFAFVPNYFQSYFQMLPLASNYLPNYAKVLLNYFQKMLSKDLKEKVAVSLLRRHSEND